MTPETLIEQSYTREKDLSDYQYQASRGYSSGPLYPVHEDLYVAKYKNLEKPWASYDIALPHTDEIYLSGEIDKKLSQQPHISILDIGCGTGAMLYDVKLKHTDRVTCVGISAKDFSHLYYTDATKNQTYAEANSKLGINVFYGDAQNLLGILDKHAPSGYQFDLITAQGSLHYMADPLLVIKNAYTLLSENGIFFAGLDGHHTSPLMAEIEKHMIENGYDFKLIPDSYEKVPSFGNAHQSTGGLIIRKTHDTLRFPLKYGTETKTENGGLTLAVSYELDYEYRGGELQN